MNLFRTKPVTQDPSANTGLRRDLNAFDLTMLGIGAIIGAGIFVLTGISAATQTGPASRRLVAVVRAWHGRMDP